MRAAGAFSCPWAVFHVLDVAFSDVRQNKLKKLWVEAIVFACHKSFHANLFVDQLHQVVHSFRMLLVVL